MKNYVHNFQIYCRTSSPRGRRGSDRFGSSVIRPLMMGAVRHLSVSKCCVAAMWHAGSSEDPPMEPSSCQLRRHISNIYDASGRTHNPNTPIRGTSGPSITPCSWFTVQKVISSFLLQFPVKVCLFSPFFFDCVFLSINFHLVSVLGKVFNFHSIL